MRRVAWFWGGALTAAVAFAALSAWLLPYEALRMDTPALRWRTWLLTLWTAGMLAICFGLAGLLGYGAPVGVRDVAEAGSVEGATAARRSARRPGAGFHGNFAWWLVVTGAWLVAVYFVAWTLGAR